MKKIVLTSILFASLIFTANAQVPDVKLGAKGGVNFSNITNSDMDSKTGFHIGVLAEVFFSEQFSLQPEILYSTQGAELKGDYSTAKYKDRKSTRLNSSHVRISYAVFCLKKKKKEFNHTTQLQE